jgi:hypothetical protein
MHIAQDESRDDYTIATSPKAIHAAPKSAIRKPAGEVHRLGIATASRRSRQDP